jgi:glycosyltransferase involved in cell wall biosynthesis
MALLDRIQRRRRQPADGPSQPPRATITKFGERVLDIAPGERPSAAGPAPAVRQGLRVAVWVCLTRRKCLEKVRGLDASPYVGAGVLFRRYPIDGLPKFRQICPPRGLRGSAVLSHLYCLIMTIGVCRRERPDLCVGIGFVPHMILARVGQLVCGARYLAWAIGGPFLLMQMGKRRWRALCGDFLRRADCTLCMGQPSRQRLIDWGWPPGRVVVGRNAYELSEYRPSAGPKKWDLIYTGHLKHEHKRLDVLVEAIDIARRELPRLTCALAGEGPFRGELERMVAERSLQDNVVLLGRREDIPELLKQARALIMTSEWEGLPASLVEAFACGLPAVLPDVGDILTFARHEHNSLIVATGRPADFAAAIVRLLKDEALQARLSQGALESGRAIRKETSGPNLSATWDRALRTAFPGLKETAPPSAR